MKKENELPEGNEEKSPVQQEKKVRRAGGTGRPRKSPAKQDEPGKEEIQKKESSRRPSSNSSCVRNGNGRTAAAVSRRPGSRIVKAETGRNNVLPSVSAAPKRETKRPMGITPRPMMRESGAKRVKIIPLGGLEQIGMNITAFECDDSIIVVDCGLAFPEDEMLGIDLVIPDITYLKDNIEKIKGFLITHGHEDHIGSLPYVLKEINVPVYATKLTIGIIENKLKEHNLLKSTKRRIVKYGQTVNLGCFRVEFIRTNHSIADAAALAIFSPAGLIIHTGDFKVDYTPIFGDVIDLQRFGELGRKGVLALLCESTNVLRAGFTPSERTVGKTFDNIFAENKNSRIIIATFASNVDREIGRASCRERV